jgi:hypothetical protein
MSTHIHEFEPKTATMKYNINFNKMCLREIFKCAFKFQCSYNMKTHKNVCQYECVKCKQ